MAHVHVTNTDELKKSVKIYIAVFVTLLVLTGITVAVASLHMSPWVAVTVALLIACTKGTLVALYFMHLIHEAKTIYWSLALCVVFFIVLMFVPLATDSNQSGVVRHNSKVITGDPHRAHGDSAGGHTEAGTTHASGDQAAKPQEH
jgi:caa(3)-type oxidase subunit IV